jgi:hypothetical protein
LCLPEVPDDVIARFRNTQAGIAGLRKAGFGILGELGQENFRTRLVRQARIVYEYDDKEVLVHMFIHTKRDFRAHLMGRLFNV